MIFGNELVGIHAGDSELHAIDESEARCLSARDHHKANHLLIAVASEVEDFYGHLIEESVVAGTILLCFSDGFAAYFLEPLLLDIQAEDVAKIEEMDLFTNDRFAKNAELREGYFYQQRMKLLYHRIKELVAQGLNPVEVLLAEAKACAEAQAARVAPDPLSSGGYHDDITLAITIID